MRVFVSVALESIQKDLIPARLIHNLIIKSGHTHTNSWNVAFYSRDKAEAPRRTTPDRVKQEVVKSDVVLVDLSIPSFGVGYFVSLAKTYKIPLIFICFEKYKDNVSKDFMRSLGLTEKTYFYNEENVETIVTKLLKAVIPKKKRMNFNIDQKFYKFLTVYAKDHKCTRTDVLQELIEEKIEKINY